MIYKQKTGSPALLRGHNFKLWLLGKYHKTYLLTLIHFPDNQWGLSGMNHSMFGPIARAEGLKDSGYFFASSIL